MNTLKITNLKIEYKKNPISVDAPEPRLSWNLESNERNQKQTAYQILVSSSLEKLNSDVGDLWDTKKVLSDQSVNISYGGKKLKTRQECFWKIRVWDQNDRISQFSETAFWRMGLLSGADWKGQWIGLKNNNDEQSSPPASYFRKEFSSRGKLHKALVYITARGVFEFHLNGKKVSNDILSPGWTDYNKRIHYLVYDVTHLIGNKNCIGIILGDGWFSGYIGYNKKRAIYGNQTSLLLQLHLEYQNKKEEVISTDSSWKCNYGPILSSDLLMGEEYDAKKDIPGWDKPDFKDKEWKPVTIFEKPKDIIVSQPCESVQITQYIKPQKITEPLKKVYVFDLGQNIVGFARIKLKNSPGNKIVIRYAEMLNPDGTIYTTNLRSAKATDTYISKGNKEETYQPHFTFHGFRYVEISGCQSKPSLNDVIGCVINSALPMTGRFECSDKMVNQLQSNIIWGQRGNFVSIPTDCPQRDERLGWMGDAEIFVQTATFNMDVAGFFTKWINDIVDAQSDKGAFTDIAPYIKDLVPEGGAPAWSDAGIIVPWTIYQSYGDTRIIETFFPAMEKFMKFIQLENPDLIRRKGTYNNYGDWLSINADTPKDLLATAFWAYDAFLMSKMAKAIKNDSASEKYRILFENIRNAFQATFIEKNGKISGETQTGYCLGLYMNLFPDNVKEKSVKYLVDDIEKRGGLISTGFVGVRHINPTLTENGFNDIAYKLLLNTKFPSWGYTIKHGATTMWERWDGWTVEKGFQDPGMNSFNHYAFGSIGEWLFRYVLGINIDIDNPGYKHIIIHPYPDKKLKFARGEYQSIHGKIVSDWKWDKGKFFLKIEIPANTTATIYIPCSDPKIIMEKGIVINKIIDIKFLRTEKNCAVYDIGSGKYNFESKY
jgi:alpha-L-rhamnosidase